MQSYHRGCHRRQTQLDARIFSKTKKNGKRDFLRILYSATRFRLISCPPLHLRQKRPRSPTMALHRAQILTLIVVVLVQNSSSFSVPQLPVVSRRVYGVSLPAQPSKDNDSSRKSKRQRLAQVIRKLPQKPRLFLGVTFASVALWRGPNNQAAHAVPAATTLERVARDEKIETLKKKDKKAALVGALTTVTAGGAAFFIARQKFDKKEEELSQEKAELEKELQKIEEARSLITEVFEETKLLEDIKGEQESLTSNLEQGNVEDKVVAFSDIINMVQSAPPDFPPKVKIAETDSSARVDHPESNDSESKLEIVEASSVIEEIRTELSPNLAVEPVVEQQTVVEGTVTEEPVIKAAVVEDVVVEEPVVSTEPIVAEEHVIEEAVVEEVVVEEPVVSTEPVVAEEPAIEEAAAEEVVVEEPVLSTEPVVAEEHVIEEAVVEEAVVEEPVVSTEPVVAEEPAIEGAVVEEAVVEEPVVSTEAVVAEEPAKEEAVVKEAIIEEPVASIEPVVALDESTELEVGLEQETAFLTKDADADDYGKARSQPKAPDEAQALKEKYAAIDSIEERAYQILVDLGIVEKLP